MSVATESAKIAARAAVRIRTEKALVDLFNTVGSVVETVSIDSPTRLTFTFLLPSGERNRLQITHGADGTFRFRRGAEVKREVTEWAWGELAL